MEYSIDAELISKRFDSALKTRIISGNNKHLIISIPERNGEKITFVQEEEFKISYYHGEFVYAFSLVFHDVIKSEEDGVDVYECIIDEVLIDNNYRKDKREIVHFKGLIMNAKEIVYATILDISSSGLKFETEVAVDKRKIELHYADANNQTMKVRGKIVWTKKISEKKYQYGFKLK